MSEIGSSEILGPGESGGGVSEGLSEQAKERFQESQRQAKQLAKDEKKSKKRDDRVAATIQQFMADDSNAHLYQLIARLVARDCPSIFILSLLSLIHAPSLEAVEEFIEEKGVIIETPDDTALISESDGLPAEARKSILEWTTRMELVMNIDALRILSKLMVDEGNIDGAVLQLATFVLIDFFLSLHREISYEKLQPLTVKILQDILEPHLGMMEEYFKKESSEDSRGSKDETDDE